MIDLATLVLAASGQAMAPLGVWLHPPERPVWPTLDEDGAVIEIAGAAPYDDSVEPVALEVTVAGREGAPLVGVSTTRVRVVEADEDTEAEWAALRDLRPGDLVRVPERSPAGLVVAWSRVVQVRRVDAPPRLFPGTRIRYGTLRLPIGHVAFATPSAFVRTPH